MMKRRLSRQRNEELTHVYQENRRLLGKDTSVSSITIKQSAVFLVLVLILGLFFGGSEKRKEDEAVRSVEEMILPEEQIRTSVKDISQEELTQEELSLSNVYGLNIRTIVLDPGHGGHDPGAVGQRGVTEKTLTLDLALRLEKRLKSHGFHVVLTRRKDISVSIRQRIQFVKNNQADLLVSIHLNALPVDTVAFIETFYFSPQGSSRVEALASRENYNSGYTVGQWQGDLEKVEQIIKLEDSHRLATHIQSKMISKMHEVNPDLADWGTRSGPFMILLNANIPAVLAEVTALSMPEEEQRLLDVEYREHLVAGLESGILAYLSERLISQTNIE